MMKCNTLALAATAVFVTLPLTVYALRPQYFVEVSLQPTSEVQAQIPCKTVLTQVDGAGIAYFDFHARLQGSKSQQLFLEIRPDAERDFRRQGPGYPVLRGVVSGVAQLGSAEYPLHQDERYTFKLIDGQAAQYLDGHIRARVFPVVSASCGSDFLVRMGRTGQLL